MNRLNNINRDVVYPVTKETLLAIEDNFQMISRVLCGLNLPSRTAVILTGATQLESYMFLYYGNLRYEIVKVVGTGVLVPQEQQSSVKNLRENPYSFALTATNHNTTIIGPNNERYVDCIIEEKYTLSYNIGEHALWKFYRLEEVLGLRRDYIPDDVFTLPDENWSLRRNACFVRPMVGINHIHIDLDIAYNGIISGHTETIIISDVEADNQFIDQLFPDPARVKYYHPLQVSMYGKVASGYLAHVSDNELQIVCNYTTVGENTAANSIEIAGDIWI